MAWGSLAALYHDASQPRAPDGELAWYAQRIAQAEGLALDVMCGAGRLLVPGLESGVKVHGVDHSPAMVARCEEKLAAGGLSTPVFRQDVVQMNLPFRYGCALIAGGAFQLITDPASAAAALERVRAHLVPPGLLLIDCRIPASAQQNLAAPLVEVRMARLADGSQIVLRSETVWTPDARMARASNRYAHRLGAQRIAEEHETVTSTWYLQDEMVELVRAAGFRDVAIEAAAGPTDEGEAFAVSARL